MNKQYEFQFRFGGKLRSFGFDVMASTVEEAVEKAERFVTHCDETCHPADSPDAQRLWISVLAPVTARYIACIYDPEGGANYGVKAFRKLQVAA